MRQETKANVARCGPRVDMSGYPPRSSVVFLVVSVAVLCGLQTIEAGPLTEEFSSEGKKHLLKITLEGLEPDEIGALMVTKYGHCKAELYKLVRGKRVLVWTRYLVNTVAPQDVLVTDSGEYVVTIKEWGDDPMDEFPLAIYGPKGELVRVFHSSTEFGDQRDKRAALGNSTIRQWNDNSIIFFGPAGEGFVGGTGEETLMIRFSFGQCTFINLANGYVMYHYKDHGQEDDEQKDHEQDEFFLPPRQFADKQIRKRAQRMLYSKGSYERNTGAMVSGQLKLRENIPRLRQLLNDIDGSYTRGSGEGTMIILYVRKAAKKALESMGEKVGNIVLEIEEKGHRKVNHKTNRYELIGIPTTSPEKKGPRRKMTNPLDEKDEGDIDKKPPNQSIQRTRNTRR